MLAAIIVGLSGKANFTNRGTSMKSLIKTGESIARVTIGLRNRGVDPFRPESYGDTIWIERTIVKEGAGKLRLMKCTNPSVTDFGKRKCTPAKIKNQLSLTCVCV